MSSGKDLPNDVEAFLRMQAGALDEELGPALVAVILSGSGALGGFIPGRSDVDVWAVCAEPLDEAGKVRVVDALVPVVEDCPTQGAEFVLYSRDAVARPVRPPRFELNLNGGPSMPWRLSFDPRDEPSHWFLLDLAIAREHGVAVIGPPPADLIGEIPREWLLEALVDSLEWHLRNEPDSPNAVLNACRAFRFAEEGRWSSKDEAARWAAERSVPSVVEAAVDAKRLAGARAVPGGKGFVEAIRGRIDEMIPKSKGANPRARSLRHSSAPEPEGSGSDL